MVTDPDTYVTRTQYNKFCWTFEEIIYCSCSSKDDFGIVTFHFGENSRIDIDLRNYVYYNKSAFYFKCRTDIILSDNNEFIVGLKGLNNTILSFNIEETKIKFFQKIKIINFFWTALIILIFVILLFFIGFLILIVFKH